MLECCLISRAKVPQQVTGLQLMNAIVSQVEDNGAKWDD